MRRGQNSRRLRVPDLWLVLAVLLAALPGVGPLWLHPTPAGPGPDLLVYGATPQGVTAAAAAARSGLRVLLVEPGDRVGGVLTQGWLATLDLSSDRLGRPLSAGLFQPFYRALHHDNSFDVHTAERALRGLLPSSVQLRLRTRLRAVQVQGGVVRQVELQAAGGRTRWVAAPRYIDASDTAELAARAGAGFTVGRQDGGQDRRQMAATLVFRLRGVNWPRLAAALDRERARLHDGAKLAGRSVYGLGPLAAAYRPSDPQRFHLRGLNGARQDDGSLLVNALLIYGVDGTDPASVRRGYRDGRRESARVVRFLRLALPDAFGHVWLAGVAPALYLRETRHLVGQQRLHADQELDGRTWSSSVAVSAYPMDGQVYRPGDAPFLLGQPQPYAVPLGALLPRGYRNLMVVSQAASFDSAAAYSARVVPLQMSLGEAAGTAAVVARLSGRSFAQLNRSRLLTVWLQLSLERHGARLTAPPGSGSCPDGRSPAASRRAARQLLRRGLLNQPYHYQGCLYLTAPQLTGEFLNDLQHQLGRPDQQALFEGLRQLYGPERPLDSGAAQLMLGLLHQPASLLDGPDRLMTRGDAARLRWRLWRLWARQGRVVAPLTAPAVPAR
ncbi:FAD-dependent oxidoreductase [Deinococcus sonorensis]|uniref:FAD-dependent oxidoreductase n=2 Tax=Deinococcus sonorensis TaxID=309891 RepID=A0AAU7UD53_9DEIO